jgi:N-acylglucosamine 2-epimerase
MSKRSEMLLPTAEALRTPGNMNLWHTQALKLEHELLENNIPFWEGYSIDRENGGYFTCLERDGKVYDTHKQLWMQWREVYMFAALFNSEYRQDRFLDLARHGFEFLVRRTKKPGGGYWYIVKADGTPVSAADGGPEVYSESFAAIACAELFLATGDARYAEEARSGAASG